jgi:hypothetical protein
MANLILQFAVSYVVGRLTEPKAPRLGDRTGFRADYGGAIPLIFGPEVRATNGTVIWATEIQETVHKHKPALDYLFGIAGALLPKRKTYTYSISFAMLMCGNPIRRLRKIWMNKKLVFDAGVSTALVFTKADGTHSLMDTVRVYQGTMTQLPDPTIEAVKGMGNTPAYLGCAYVVIDQLQLETFNNGIPSSIELLVEEATECKLYRVSSAMLSASGIDVNTVSTTSLTQTVRGFVVDQPTTVADAFSPLIQAYQFDLADAGGTLRMVSRGRYPRTVVPYSQLAGHDRSAERPEAIRWTRETETKQPREVTVNYYDPARDFQPNAAVTRRSAGSAQSNIVLNTGLTLTADEAQRCVDEVLWEAWSGRQTATTTTDETRDDIEAAQVHAFLSPNGWDTYRVVRRTKGANNVINLELRADRPLIYGDALPGIPAALPGQEVVLPGVLNDPIFVEPPSSLAPGQIWVALSAQKVGGGADPDFGGVNVWVATADVEADYRNAGASNAAAFTGELTADLAAYVGANPDGASTMSADLTESAGQLESISAADAATGGINLVWVDGEFLTFQTSTPTMAFNYDATDLWRGLHGTTAGLHADGSRLAVLDDAIFRFAIPAEMLSAGTLYFKFPQLGQALADVPSWPYSPAGTGYGGGAGGVPTAPTGVALTPGAQSMAIAWAANPATDNVTAYEVWRAAGLGGLFGAAAKVATVGGLGWTDTGLGVSTAYTYFIVAVNAVGSSGPSAAEDDTTTAVAIGGGTSAAITASQTLAAGDLVNLHTVAGAIRMRLADATDTTKPADGFVLAAVVSGAAGTFQGPGQINDQVAGLTPGATYWLSESTPGGLTNAAPATSLNGNQIVGKALSATKLLFSPQPMFEAP